MSFQIVGHLLLVSLRRHGQGVAQVVPNVWVDYPMLPASNKRYLSAYHTHQGRRLPRP
jgi:hypothetical protein